MSPPDERQEFLEMMARQFDRGMYYDEDAPRMTLKTSIRMVAVSFFLLGLVVGLIAAGVLQ